MKFILWNLVAAVLLMWVVMYVALVLLPWALFAISLFAICFIATRIISHLLEKPDENKNHQL